MKPGATPFALFRWLLTFPMRLWHGGPVRPCRPSPLDPRPTSLLALAALGALAAAGCESTAGQPGEALPAKFLKEHGLQGKVVLIEFGLYDCALSGAGLDKMIEMCRDNQPPDLACVRVEAAQDAAAVDAYYKAKSVPFTVYRDPGAALGRAFDATVYPVFLLVDKYGRVRYRGAFPEIDKLPGWVDTLQREKADAGDAAPVFGVTPLAVQKLLDETRLPDLQGAVKPLRDYMGRRGVLAVFVDSTCPFSGKAIADITKVSGALAKHEMPSVLVNLAEKKEKVLEFYASHSTGTPVLYDETRATQKAWQVNSVPTVLLFDAAGSVAYRGKAVWADVAKAAEAALKLPAGSLNLGAKGTEFG